MELYVDDIFQTGHKYKDNPLWDFFLTRKHRPMSKWVHYFGVYDKWLRNYRGKDIVMMEIGIDSGGSLEMWKDYFGAKATIIGVDIKEECKTFAEERIAVEIGSQEDPSFWNYIKEKYPRIDILLDDGGHTMKQQRITFELMFKHLSDGGLYICEDTHTSYIEGYKQEGEIRFIEYMKKIVDEINAFYNGNPVEVNYNTKNIGGIHFYDGIIVVEKERRYMPPFSMQILTEGNKNVSTVWANPGYFVKDGAKI